VLLHGPPGTGKTMLARAMAAESNVAFLPISASTFVTICQGSSPQSVRDLFARARRYAPAVSRALLKKNRLYRTDLEALLPGGNPAGEKNLAVPTQH
jgi:replication-associated recombination protein RarA